VADAGAQVQLSGNYSSCGRIGIIFVSNGDEAFKEYESARERLIAMINSSGGQIGQEYYFLLGDLELAIGLADPKRKDLLAESRAHYREGLKIEQTTQVAAWASYNWR